MNRFITICILLLFATSVISQKKYWVDHNGNKTKKNFATFYYTFTKKEKNFILNKFNVNSNKIVESVPCLQEDTTSRNGIFTAYYNTGEVSTKGEYLNGKRIKIWKTFYTNGKLLSKVTYINGLREKTYYEFTPKGDTIVKGNYKSNLKTGIWNSYTDQGKINCKKNYLRGTLHGENQCFYHNGKLQTVTNYINGKKEKETLFYTEEGKLYIPASFKNKKLSMMSYLAKNTKYPMEAIDRNIQGSAYIAFTVDEKGVITNVHSAALPGREVHQLLVKEAIRVVSSMPTWNPATSEGKSIPTSFSVPVNFRIR